MENILQLPSLSQRCGRVSVTGCLSLCITVRGSGLSKVHTASRPHGLHFSVQDKVSTTVQMDIKLKVLQAGHVQCHTHAQSSHTPLCVLSDL